MQCHRLAVIAHGSGGNLASEYCRSDRLQLIGRNDQPHLDDANDPSINFG